MEVLCGRCSSWEKGGGGGGGGSGVEGSLIEDGFLRFVMQKPLQNTFLEPFPPKHRSLSNNFFHFKV